MTKKNMQTKNIKRTDEVKQTGGIKVTDRNTHRKITNDRTKHETYQANLKRVVAESVLTSIGAGFSVATITVFWNSIGMDQSKIGFVQMMYTIVVLLLDIPMGYVADRFNRKILNIIGDIGVGITFAFYALSKNMYMAILAESLLAIFTAMTNGVDSAILKSTACSIDSTGKLFEKTNAKMHTLRYVMLLIVTVIGGFVAKYSIRLTIALSFVPYFIGGLIAIRIEDFGEKADAKGNIASGMFSTMKEVLKDSKTRVYMMCYILGKEVTHANIWLFTPMLIDMGVPTEMLCIGWILNQIMQIVGGKVGEIKMVNCKKISKRFAIPMIIQFSWLILVICHTNIVTIWLFSMNGFVRGLADAALVTPLQFSVDEKIQTSVMSMASTGARLVYIPMVYFANRQGNIEHVEGLKLVVAVFLPVCVIAYFLLRKIERGKSVSNNSSNDDVTESISKKIDLERCA